MSQLVYETFTCFVVSSSKVSVLPLSESTHLVPIPHHVAFFPESHRQVSVALRAPASAGTHPAEGCPAGEQPGLIPTQASTDAFRC